MDVFFSSYIYIYICMYREREGSFLTRHDCTMIIREERFCGSVDHTLFLIYICHLQISCLPTSAALCVFVYVGGGIRTLHVQTLPLLLTS